MLIHNNLLHIQLQVQNKNLDRVKDSLGKRREQMQKEYTRKLTLWHMELERNKNHSDPALKVVDIK